MQSVTLPWLQSLEVFHNVPDGQLQWFLDNSNENAIQNGDFLIEPGQAITGPHLIFSGKVQMFILQNGGRREYTDFVKGDIIGYLPYSRGKIGIGYAQAKEDTLLLSFPTERVMDMIKLHFELTQAFVHVMSNRVRNFTEMRQQNEKMMALGKLSAGLAHELNNPASAIVRDSISLKEHLKLDPRVLKNMLTIKIEEAAADLFNEELFKVISAEHRPYLTLKQRTQREDEIADWFDEIEVENAYAIAESYVDFNFTVENLKACAVHIPPHHLSTLFNRISSLLITERMVDDIQESSDRIATLVNSVKNFTHMDRAQDKQYADIHNGIRNTLTMLGYKLKKGNITLMEEYDHSLPEVKALIGELNQVWTNLIDNAIDAMEANGQGILVLKTERDREFVQVSIINDGPDIEEENLPKIFDPFFTTKTMGKGTGMGLEVVQRIVNQHNGSVKVKSKDGHTAFVVCFPIDG
ncbi:ATP-binding protein [Pedobacter sp. AW31-3R]|uniref:ATP-binding protein n=1 Tax=Pedobacter sp. AW31-3R TaxID=3445781 RepID=UPI003FA0282A